MVVIGLLSQSVVQVEKVVVAGPQASHPGIEGYFGTMELVCFVEARF